MEIFIYVSWVMESEERPGTFFTPVHTPSVKMIVLGQVTFLSSNWSELSWFCSQRRSCG
jgi:hypothetical protein